MKNSMKTIIIFTILALIISCSKSENPKITDKPNVSLPMIQTVVAQNTLSSEATFGGTILNNGGGIIMKRGICWGFEDSPSVLLNNFVEDTNNQLGSFEFKVIGRLNPGTFYYVRAYCENEAGLQYGNTINLTTAVDVSILNPSDITSTKAKFKGNINQNGFSYLGFVYGTSPNPTINNNFVNTSISGSYNYDVIVENLIPNTLYYVRGTYPKPEGGFSYTQQKQFKTTGYFGPAGGYVAYDKGEIIDGWRYLIVCTSSCIER